MSVKQRQEGEMDERDLDVPSAAELADCEAELPEWDRLRVRDHWDAVVSEELGEEPVPEEHEPRTTFLRGLGPDISEVRSHPEAHNNPDDDQAA
jgi:hypothetical protein